MNTVSYVFTQHIKILPKEAFDWIVKQYDRDEYVRRFTCWNQLLVMMFGKRYSCERLRELVSIISAHSRKAYLFKMSVFDVLCILRGSIIDRMSIRELFKRAVDEGPQIRDDPGFQLSFNFLVDTKLFKIMVPNGYFQKGQMETKNQPIKLIIFISIMQIFNQLFIIEL